jgi:hypothetical protein
MILLTSNKREFPITVIKNLHNALNDYYINEVYGYEQNDSSDYQNIVNRFSKSLEELYDLIQEMKRYNNNNNDNK